MDKIVTTLRDTWENDVAGVVFWANGSYCFMAKLKKDMYTIVSFEGRLWNGDYMNEEEARSWLNEMKAKPIGRIEKTFRAKEITMKV